VFLSSLRDGHAFSFISQPFVLGYFRQVPAGLIFSNHQRNRFQSPREVALWTTVEP
jgi:hypothetical protein